MPELSKRQLILGSASMAAGMFTSGSPAQAANAISLSSTLTGWETVTGDWGIQDVPGAVDQGRALLQRATKNEYNVIVAPGGPYKNVSVSVRFKPISGREDASGGIVFRYADGRYYLIRANALEDNFRLYYYDRGSYMITTATVNPPTLGQWHRLQISAKGDRLQGWLNERLLIDHQDKRFVAGRIGLWTKADSVTAFDSLSIEQSGD